MLEIIHSNPTIKIKCWKCGEYHMYAKSGYESDDISLTLECRCGATAELEITKMPNVFSWNNW